MGKKNIPTIAGSFIIIIIAVTVGMFVWRYEERDTYPQEITLPKKSQKISTQSNGQKNPFENFKISPFSKWELYQDGEIGFSVKYPPELYLDTTDPQKIFFDYLGPDDELQKQEGSVLLHFNVASYPGTPEQYIEEYKLNELLNFQKSELIINGVNVQKITHTDAFAGGNLYTVFFQSENRTVIVNYAGDNQMEETFDKMLSTDESLKTEVVDFCGEEYRVTKIMIGRTDISKTIAAISKNQNWTCENLKLANFNQNEIAITSKREPALNNALLIFFFHKGNEREASDLFKQTPFVFKIDSSRNEILYQNQADGKFREFGKIN